MFVRSKVANEPCRSSFLVTECESSAMSEAVVIEPPREDQSVKSLADPPSFDDGSVNTAAYVNSDTSATL